MSVTESGPSTPGQSTPGPSTQELSTWDDDDLDVDYFEAQGELPGRPLRKRMGPFTIGLIVFTFAAVAFFAGVLVEKHDVKSTSGSNASAISSLINRFRGAAATGAGTGAATGAGGAAAGGGSTATRGTITLIDGSNIYVTVTGGTIIKVQTNPGTTFSVTSSGAISNLHPGDNVTVSGPTDSSGNQTATAVADTGSGGGGGVAVRGGGGTGGGGGGAAAGGGGGGAVIFGGG